MQYDPYGEVLTSTLPAALTDRLFTGQQLDSSTGLYYYNARYYDPHLGRFIQPDTLVPDPLSPQAWNRFSYVYNNPVTYNDPSGHQPPIIGLMLIGAGVFALVVEVNQISDYAERHDMTFWEAAAQADTYLDQAAMVEAAVEGGFFTLLAAESMALALLYGGVGLTQLGGSSPRIAGWGLSMTNIGAQGHAWLWSVGGDEVTARLQALADQSVQTIDDLGDAAYSQEMLDAIAEHPHLRQAYRGSLIDAEFKRRIADDPVLSRLDIARLFQFKPDVLDPDTSRWWELTKPWLWQDHFDKYEPVYGPDGTLIPYE